MKVVQLYKIRVLISGRIQGVSAIMRVFDPSGAGLSEFKKPIHLQKTTTENTRFFYQIPKDLIEESGVLKSYAYKNYAFQ